jgi:hypothetical protein
MVRRDRVKVLSDLAGLRPTWLVAVEASVSIIVLHKVTLDVVPDLFKHDGDTIPRTASAASPHNDAARDTIEGWNIDPKGFLVSGTWTRSPSKNSTCLLSRRPRNSQS